jgi:hypothetical protein
MISRLSNRSLCPVYIEQHHLHKRPEQRYRGGGIVSYNSGAIDGWIIMADEHLVPIADWVMLRDHGVTRQEMSTINGQSTNRPEPVRVDRDIP